MAWFILRRAPLAFMHDPYRASFRSNASGRLVGVISSFRHVMSFIRIYCCVSNIQSRYCSGIPYPKVDALGRQNENVLSETSTLVFRKKGLFYPLKGETSSRNDSLERIVEVTHARIDRIQKIRRGWPVRPRKPRFDCQSRLLKGVCLFKRPPSDELLATSSYNTRLRKQTGIRISSTVLLTFFLKRARNTL